MTRWIAFAGMVICAAALSTPTVGADSGESEYMWELGAMGITSTTTGRSPAQLLAMGHSFCGMLAGGVDPNQIAASTSKIVRVQSETEYTMGQLWVGSALNNLCPEAYPHVLPWVHM
jgi:hypothetical protein